MIYFKILLVLAAITHSLSNTTKIQSAEEKLLEHLVKKYSRSLRPIKNQSNSFDVHVNMKLIKLQQMDERNQQITIQTQLEIAWISDIFTWNPAKWGVSVIKVSPEVIWFPDLTLTNNADKEKPIPHAGTDTVTLFYDGTHFWGPKYTLTSFFDADIRYFPFDIQNCSFVFALWGMDVSTIRLHPILTTQIKGKTVAMTMIDNTYMRSSEWDILNTKKNVIYTSYRGTPWKTAVMVFSYTFTRKSWYYLVTAIIPVLILIVIVVFSYALPANSGERIGVSITVLLAYAVYLDSITATLPRNADSTSMLSIFYLVSMGTCTLSFVGTCIVIKLIHYGESGSLPPRWLRSCFLKRKYREENTKRSYVTRNNSYSSPTDMKDNTAKIEETPLNPSNSMDSTLAGNTMVTSETCLETLVKEIKEIRETLSRQNMHNSMKRATIIEKENEEKAQADWLRIAELLDYVFAVFFFVASIVLSICILIPAYVGQQNEKKGIIE